MSGDIPWDLLAAAGLLLANRVVGKTAAGHAAAYWGLQAADVGAALWFVFVGVAGLESMRVPGFVIAALFVLHLFTNASNRSRAQAEDPRPPWRRPPPV